MQFRGTHGFIQLKIHPSECAQVEVVVKMWLYCGKFTTVPIHSKLFSLIAAGLRFLTTPKMHGHWSWYRSVIV